MHKELIPCCDVLEKPRQKLSQGICSTEQFGIMKSPLRRSLSIQLSYPKPFSWQALQRPPGSRCVVPLVLIHGTYCVFVYSFLHVHLCLIDIYVTTYVECSDKDMIET